LFEKCKRILFVGASVLGAVSGNAAASALQRQIETHVQASALESATTIEQQLSHWMRSTATLGLVAEHLFEHASQPVYNRNDQQYADLLRLVPGAPFYDQGDQLTAALQANASVYYVPQTTIDSFRLDEAARTVQEAVRRSAQLDATFRAVMRDVPAIAALYVGFESGGVFRRFPASQVFSVNGVRFFFIVNKLIAA
jgi:hypothetical protein